jgi:hypothetical protein
VRTMSTKCPFNGTFSMRAVLDAQNNWTISEG